jgi:hypothetical protein
MSSMVWRAACAITIAISVGAMSFTTARAGDQAGAIAAGVIGGIALGALAAGAAQQMGPPPYEPAPERRVRVYEEPRSVEPVEEVEVEECHVERRPVLNSYGETVGRRSVRVCE